MSRRLTPRPNLEHLRGQAKDLLSSYRTGEPAALKLFREFLPEAAGAPARTAAGRPYVLADAQSAIARQHGFPRWPRLVHYVEQLRDLEGTWRFQTLEIEGSPFPAAALSGSRLIIDGSLFRMHSPEADYVGNFDIDVEASPHTIDIDFTEGPETGNTNHGIFALDGDGLKICLDMTGKGRPSAFATTPGSGWALETLRRGEPAPRDSGATDAPAAPAADPLAGPLSLEGFGQVNAVTERLEGPWIPLSILRDGLELPAAFAGQGRRVGQGAETTVTFGGQLWMKAQMRVDPSQDPMAIDYLHTAGPTEGLIQLGIMEWIGEDVRFCLAEPGRVRPKEFQSPPGSGRTLTVWRRAR